MLKLSESGGEDFRRSGVRQDPGQDSRANSRHRFSTTASLYGIMPEGCGSLKGQFVCYKPDGSLSCGRADRTTASASGSFIVADSKFYLLGDEGELTMADATKQEFVRLGQTDVLANHDA